jgi:Rft protein
MASLVIPLGILLTFGVCFGWNYFGEAASFHHTAVWLQGAAAAIELLIEPLFILAQHQLRFRLRVAVDGAATIIKSSTALILLHKSRYDASVALSLAQIAYATTILLGYVGFYLPGFVGFLWRRRPTCKEQSSGKPLASKSPANVKPLFDTKTLVLIGTFELQVEGLPSPRSCLQFVGFVHG